MNDIAEILPAATTSIRACGGVSRRGRLIISPATPAPTTISGASGPSTSPKPIVANPARTTPGHDLRARGAAGRQALGGDMPAVARQAGDRHRHDQRTHGQDRKRPPLRRAVLIADRMREMHVQLLLDLKDRLKKAPGRDRNDHANDRDHHQQADERLAAHRRVSLLGGQLWRSARVGHTLKSLRAPADVTAGRRPCRPWKRDGQDGAVSECGSEP